MTVPRAVFLYERVIVMIEDAMVHYGPKGNFRALGAYLQRCKELREKLANAETPEEVDAIERELEECRKRYMESKVETAVKIDE